MSAATVTLESLGLSPDDIAERVVETMVDKLLHEFYTDDEGRSTGGRPSAFGETMRKRVIACIDTAIQEIAAKHVLPNIAEYVETLCLQATNAWGEKKGASLTFVEYLVLRAQNYIGEQVDSDGRSEAEAQARRDTWYSGKQTRITYLVHQHLHYSIEEAMKKAVLDANRLVVGGIEATVKQKLAEVAAKMTIAVGTGR